MKVEEESEKVGLKLNIQKTKIMASGSIISWQIDGEKMETVTDFTFLEVKKQRLELDMEQRTVSKLGKEYVKAVYCHHAYAEYIMWNAGLDEA